jgi:tRNA (guanine-N7-)-methyltransferase
VLPYSASLLDARAVFGRTAPLAVEIGFGMGAATAAVAAAEPGVDLLGIEVHPPGVGALLQRIEADGLGNVRIVQHDAVEVLRDMIAPGSLAAVRVWFPDPWPKKRHHKRRLLQPAFVRLVAERLAPGGTLHAATDWVPYAEEMLATFAGEPLLADASLEGGFVPRPASRPETKFEVRGLRLGHAVRDLLFVRRPSAPSPAPP